MMTDNNTLTVEIAEDWLSKPGHGGICQFTRMTTEAAESLSRYRGKLGLDLSGLASLSDAAARSLSRLARKFRDLCLRALSSREE